MAKDLSEFTPEQFVRIYKTLKSRLRDNNITEARQATEVKSSAEAELGSLKRSLEENARQYRVRKVGGVRLYIDRIEDDEHMISFDGFYTITPYVEKRQVVTGYYKNGKARTRMQSFSFLKFQDGSNVITMAAGDTITDARQAQKEIETIILESRVKKLALDVEKERLRGEILRCEKSRDAKLKEVTQQFAAKRESMAASLQRMFDEGSGAQIRKLFMPSRIVLAVIAGFLGIPFVMSGFDGYANFASTMAEASSSYAINVDDEYDFDCDLQYSEKQHVFYCAGKQYDGTISATKASVLQAGQKNVGVESDDSFVRELPLQIITPDEWAYENANFGKIFEKHSQSIDNLEIYNKTLKRFVAQKNIKINWHYSDEDKATAQKVWNGWRAEQEEKARRMLADEQAREAERKAKEAEEAARVRAEEEAARLEAENRRRIEEEEKRLETERLRQEEENRRRIEEEATRRAQQQQSQKSYNNASSGSGSGSGGVNTGNGARRGAVCGDGTTSSATGSGACSRHGGVSYWLYD